MAATAPRQSTTPTPSRPRTGVVTFAGVLFLIVAAFNLLDGVVALVNDDYFRADELLFGDLSAWGVWWLLVGAMQAVAGFMIVTRRPFGVIFGVALAGINAVTQLIFIGAYPAWSIAVMVVDGLIIYALTTHIEDFE